MGIQHHSGSINSCYYWCTGLSNCPGCSDPFAKSWILKPAKAPSAIYKIKNHKNKFHGCIYLTNLSKAKEGCKNIPLLIQTNTLHNNNFKHTKRKIILNIFAEKHQNTPYLDKRVAETWPRRQPGCHLVWVHVGCKQQSEWMRSGRNC